MKNEKNMNIRRFILVSAFVFLAALVFYPAEAQENSNPFSDSADAIAVRVVPNPNHYSIASWYRSQGFAGSPQALTVDGYEAIRDGRTVYVNAANVSDSKDVFTNIYVISYSQEPSEKTVDILGQIISRWKFNDNLSKGEFSDASYSCSVSSFSCQNDSDCSNDQICSTSGNSTGSCVLLNKKNCLIDSDCPSGFFCDSHKAMIIRDTKRIGRLEEMKEALANYRQKTGYYPRLTAGTYLANKSVSVWPSWSQNFLSELAVSPNYVDPINRLGYCPGFDKITCWDEISRRFVNDPGPQSLPLPDNSYVMVYASNSEGSSYNLCSSLESYDFGYEFNPGDYSGSACLTNFTTGGGSGANISPIVVDYYLSAQAGRALNGYIRVFDENNDPLEWEISTGDASKWLGWSAAPVLIDTSNKFEKKVYAASTPITPSNNNYNFNLIVSDGRGGAIEETFSIKIEEPGVFIEAENSIHTLKEGTPFYYSFYFSGENLSPNPSASDYVVQKISGPEVGSFFVREGDGKPVPSGNNRYKVSYTGTINPANYPNGEFSNDVRIGFDIRVRDRNNKWFNKVFYVDFLSLKPPLNFSCPLSARINSSGSYKYFYNCLVGPDSYLDQKTTYRLEGLPSSDFSLDLGSAELSQNSFYISGYPKSFPGNQAGSYFNVKVSATSPFGAKSQKEFSLRINSYCGDGIKQAPNSEGRGGLYNDGYEDCDGLDGVAAHALDNSSINRQYACNTNVGDKTPFEISSGNYCVFKYPLDGGGFCGDGFCQTAKERRATCPVDCGINAGEGDDTACFSDRDCDIGFICDFAIRDCKADPSYCTADGQCDLGYKCTSNKCEKKSWVVEEIVKDIQFLEGDATLAGVTYEYYKGVSTKSYRFTSSQINNTYPKKICLSDSFSNPTNPLANCTFIQIDNPICVDNTKYTSSDNTHKTNQIKCPIGFKDLKRIGVATGDSCRDKDDLRSSRIPGNCTDNWLTTNWCDRYRYECVGTDFIVRYFGDSCKTIGSKVINGTMNYNGVCVVSSSPSSSGGGGGGGSVVKEIEGNSGGGGGEDLMQRLE